ncbi:TetR/AcrR family transcriptional regulator [Streptomyces tubbatahanensis]|uniref:TetR/AcrR family transcriptional regulator n=1 Tax=Streptomyces tubbatahanensis TaxID=2923272 RepID=A0ABY3XYW2_9ACTN|nr:TetR/AcrR family transcriptional regulator [Streptomyces tubbatahanensis]UNS99682.1 TetR/AcrR family transcriptional regulator [Streptomyces tubbatahanensis]
MVQTKSEGRRYSGLDPDERDRKRREAVLGAALELFGTQGYAATSVKRVCREAGLTERYFYACFRDRHDCLAGLYAELTDSMRAAVLAALDKTAGSDLDTRAHTGLDAFIGFLTADPRRARVVLIEVVGVSDELEARRNGVLREFADLITAVWSLPEEPATRAAVDLHRLTAVGLVGAVNHLLVDWLQRGQEDDPATLVDVCSALFSAARERVG